MCYPAKRRNSLVWAERHRVPANVGQQDNQAMNAERPTARLQTKNQQRPPGCRKRYLAMRLSFLFFAVLIVFAIGCGRVENMESKQKAFERLKDERSKFEPGYPARCLEFATANEGCEVGIDALFWVTSCNRNTVGFQDVNDLALERLVTKYLDHPKTQSAVFQMHKQRSPKTVEHLEMLLNCDKETIRGLAMFSLGVRIKAKEKSERCLCWKRLSRIILV